METGEAWGLWGERHWVQTQMARGQFLLFLDRNERIPRAAESL